MNPPTTQRFPDFREETYGRRLESMRWHHGKLQMGFVEKFSQYEGRRLITTGERTVWEDVPGDPPEIREEKTSELTELLRQMLLRRSIAFDSDILSTPPKLTLQWIHEQDFREFYNTLHRLFGDEIAREAMGLTQTAVPPSASAGSGC